MSRWRRTKNGQLTWFRELTFPRRASGFLSTAGGRATYLISISSEKPPSPEGTARINVTFPSFRRTRRAGPFVRSENGIKIAAARPGLKYSSVVNHSPLFALRCRWTRAAGVFFFLSLSASRRPSMLFIPRLATRSARFSC